MREGGQITKTPAQLLQTPSAVRALKVFPYVPVLQPFEDMQ